MKRLILSIAVLASLSCSPPSPKEVAKAEFPKEAVNEKNNKVIFNPRVDILFIIDNSLSMENPQANLVANIQRFVSNISRLKVLDFHIGVLTSDMYSSNFSGKLQGNPRFVTNSTPNLENALANNLEVGTFGDGTERFYDPIQAALSTPLLTGFNQGFYRPDASLALVFITDAAEQSVLDNTRFNNFLLDLKKGDRNKILGYGVLNTTWELDTCYTQESPNSKIEDFLNSMSNSDGKNNNILSICSLDFGDRLADFAADIAKRSAGILYLNQTPIPGTIQVTYGNQVIPNDASVGWTYDPSTNSLRFGDKIVWTDQGLGAEVSVKFATKDWD